MVHLVKSMFVPLATSVAAVQAASQATCGAGSQCPKDSPCCSQYGQCGTGAYCLGGCDPRYSFDLTSCMATPVCTSGDFKMDSLDDISPNTQYLGDPSTANWVSSGTPVVYNNDSILLTMAQGTVGTLLSSTHYVWYGEISATLTTSQGAGVVTAFIMMSDVKDEIDFEFVGTDLEHVQSNYYFQGITDYDNELNLSVSNTLQNTHTYTVNWSPDSLTWAVDGVVGRTLNRNTTYNSTTGQYHYPQSPSRIELSLWPAGLSSNGAGTIAWAGGLVDWNSPDMQNGYYYAMVNDVNVQCYSPPSGYQNLGSKSYSYLGDAGTNDTVAITNNNTILASFEATGDNQNYNPDGTKSSASASGTQAAATASASSQNTVPGVSGAGAYSGTSNGDDDSSSSNGASNSASGSASGTASSSFTQDTTTPNEGARVVAGSLVALVAFFAAAMML